MKRGKKGVPLFRHVLAREPLGSKGAHSHIGDVSFAPYLGVDQDPPRGQIPDVRILEVESPKSSILSCLSRYPQDGEKG